TYTVRADGSIKVGVFGELKVAGQSKEGLAEALQRLLEGRIPQDDQVALEISLQPREYPTIAEAREFQKVRLGETVRLEVLADPSTGEKLYDVIQPLSPPARRTIAPEDEIVLDRMRILVNGRTIHEARNSTMIGEAVKLALPGHGTVYLTVK